MEFVFKSCLTSDNVAYSLSMLDVDYFIYIIICKIAMIWFAYVCDSDSVTLKLHPFTESGSVGCLILPSAIAFCVPNTIHPIRSMLLMLPAKAPC
jgi:hypothetical protein